MYAAVLEENLRKNRAVDILQQTLPGLTQDECTWAYDADRVLHLSIPSNSISGATITAVRDALATQLGLNKVVLS